MIKTLSEFAYKIHLVEAKHPRALPLSELQTELTTIERFHIRNLDSVIAPPIQNGDISETIKHVLTQCTQPDELLLIIGSFFIMPETRRTLFTKDYSCLLYTSPSPRDS
eukprot:TRINITY_DN9817_c0_g1_i1.p1 TRINITY_DN9817_c0_g1~~TRINITY_DN9817_c0_g1_i1.p1  ORF type:complete len:109 (+),score=27.17 TRINITY_DN9817_c0_g1_i1:218-544(+)